MRIVLLLTFLAIASCTTVSGERPSGFKIPAPDANFGPYPDVEGDAARYFDTVLRDPTSAQYRVDRVGKAYCNDGLLFGGDVNWAGYAANVYVNARNGYGGYTGFTGYTLLWNSAGVLADEAMNGADFGIGRGVCSWMPEQQE